MLSVEFIRECGNLIERFGFPIFFGCFALLMAYLSFRHFTKQIVQKDCDFKEYAEKRDEQILTMSEKHIEASNKMADAFNHNTSAINELKNSVRARAGKSKVQTEAIRAIVEKLPDSPPTNAIPKPENDLEH